MNFVAFYLGNEPDHRGRTLEEMLRWSDEKLEAGHDYIHVLFPLSEPSNHIPNAPVLDALALAEFRRDATIQKNLVRAFQMMLRFYGLQFDASKQEVVPAPDFSTRAANWLLAGDHNHLRITRILKCLGACGLGGHAAALLKGMLAIAEPGKVSQVTLGYWRGAVSS